MQQGHEGGLVGGEHHKFVLRDVQRTTPPAEGEGTRACLVERTELGGHATLVAHAWVVWRAGCCTTIDVRKNLSEPWSRAADGVTCLRRQRRHHLRLRIKPATGDRNYRGLSLHPRR